MTDSDKHTAQANICLLSRNTAAHFCDTVISPSLSTALYSEHFRNIRTYVFIDLYIGVSLLHAFHYDSISGRLGLLYSDAQYKKIIPLLSQIVGR